MHLVYDSALGVAIQVYASRSAASVIGHGLRAAEVVGVVGFIAWIVDGVEVVVAVEGGALGVG